MKRFFMAIVMVALVASPALAKKKHRHHKQHHSTDVTNTNRNDIRNSNRNSNRNTNRNSNRNSNYNSNSNRNSNENTNVNKNSNRQSQGQYQGQAQSQGQNQKAISGSTSRSTATAVQGQSIKDKNQQSVNIEGDSFKAYASPPDAIAPSLTSGNDVCMGSISGSASGGNGIIGIGIGFGKTYTDENCVRLKNANALLQMGHKGAALALLALNEDVAAALVAARVPFASLTVETEPFVMAIEDGLDLVEDILARGGSVDGFDFGPTSD